MREYTKPNYSGIVSNTHRKIARVCGSARLVLVELLDMTNVGAIVFRRRRAQTKNWTIFHTITATIYKYVFSLLRRLSTRRCPHLLSASLWLYVAADEKLTLNMAYHCTKFEVSTCTVFSSLLSINIFRLRRSATNPQHAAAAVDRWDRQTDGRTDGCSTVS